MLDPKKFEELAQKLADCLPSQLKEWRAELKENFKSVLQGTLHKMDIVTREEFEVQQKVLARTREKLEQLEKHVYKAETSQDDVI